MSGLVLESELLRDVRVDYNFFRKWMQNYSKTISQVDGEQAYSPADVVAFISQHGRKQLRENHYYRVLRSFVLGGVEYKGRIGELSRCISNIDTHQMKLKFHDDSEFWFDYNDLQVLTDKDLVYETPVIINVVVIKDAVIDQNYCFVGNQKEMVSCAEKKFAELCKEYVPRYDENNLPDFLNDGYVIFDTDCSICLSWAN